MSEMVGSEPLILFEKLADGFGEQQWSAVFTGAFDLNTPISGLMAEAKARGLVVRVAATLVTYESVFPEPDDDEYKKGTSEDVDAAELEE